MPHVLLTHQLIPGTGSILWQGVLSGEGELLDI
jgi:hypothetical protein